ncbi:MAG: HU family DNA-binding protein [Proteobacteria bacterium]|nr:HU family DNA-binding protein [Pseudomonadota bacterium]
MVLLNRKDWVEMFKMRAGLDEKTAEKVASAMEGGIKDGLSVVHRVNIPGVGQLHRRFRKGRQQYVGSVGRFCEVEDSYRYSFKASSGMKRVAEQADSGSRA